MFDDLTKQIEEAFTYKPMTDEAMQISYVNDIQEWAEAIAGEWDGDNPGRLEDRATCASEIIAKLNEVKELIAEMENL
jgi:hypothetical protein